MEGFLISLARNIPNQNRLFLVRKDSPEKGDGFNDKYIKVVRNKMANQLFANGKKILNYLKQSNKRKIKGKKGWIMPSFF